jgi:hypothetical protein
VALVIMMFYVRFLPFLTLPLFCSLAYTISFFHIFVLRVASADPAVRLSCIWVRIGLTPVNHQYLGNSLEAGAYLLFLI